MKILNCTPHAIVLRKPDGTDITVPPSGQVARVSMAETDIGTVAGLPTIRREPGEVTGLPAEQPGTIILVSAMVLAAVSGRGDVYAPDTGPTAVRDERGHIVAVTRLVAAN